MQQNAATTQSFRFHLGGGGRNHTQKQLVEVSQ